MEVSGDAPVPPSKPLIRTTSALPFATPGRHRADADLGDELHGDARLGLFEFFRSWISCARSSIE